MMNPLSNKHCDILPNLNVTAEEAVGGVFFMSSPGSLKMIYRISVDHCPLLSQFLTILISWVMSLDFVLTLKIISSCHQLKNSQKHFIY